MERKVKHRESFDYMPLDYEGDQPIEALEEILNHLKNFGATHFEVYVDKAWDGSEVYGIEFTPVKITFETFEEQKVREEKETAEKEKALQEAKERQEAYEREQLKRLKEKYE